MPVYRVTFGFEGLGKGWSETHAAKNPSETPQGLVADAINVAQKRVTFLGREFAINAIRISKYSNDDATERQRGVFPVKQEFKNPVQTVSQAAEPAVVALIGFGRTNVNIAPPGFAANTNRTFLGAPPDDAVNNGGVVDPAKANLGVNFNQWAAAVVAANYGWLASARIADLAINTISQNADGTVEIIVKPPVPNTVVIGQTYTARARRINNANSPLNGPLILTYVAANTFITQEVIGLGLAQAGGFVRVYKPVQPFVPFAAVDLQLLTAKHQRGRPFGSIPGRARRRIRG